MAVSSTELFNKLKAVIEMPDGVVGLTISLNPDTPATMVIERHIKREEADAIASILSVYHLTEKAAFDDGQSRTISIEADATITADKVRAIVEAMEEPINNTNPRFTP